MDDGQLFWAVIAKAWPDVEEPDDRKKLQHATAGQRAILATTIFIRELDNGGFEQFFYNSSGDIADEVIAGFVRLGSPEHAGVVRQALAFFGPNGATANQSARRDMLQRTSKADKDAFFEPLSQKLYGESRLWPLYRQYLDQHPTEFFT
jgi:hypothetical protein